MAYSFKGSLSFGLVYIPITLHGCVKQNDIGFNMIDRKTMTRVKYKKSCEECGEREVAKEDIVKGYEYEDGKYVIFEEADFEKLKTPKDKNITIERFVQLEQIDPIYYDKSYYVSPTGAEKAFYLVLKAMEEEGKAGIAKTVIGTKETLVAIRVKDGKMLLNTLFFADEIQANPVKELSETVKDAEMAMAKSVIESMSGAFEPEQYRDEYRERLKQAIEAKISGEEIVVPKEKTEQKVVDLMEALKLTLKQTTERKKSPMTKKLADKTVKAN